MTDLPEKVPVKHERIEERSSSVEGLLDDTMRGVSVGNKPWNLAIGKENHLQENIPVDSWQRVLDRVRESLTRQSMKDSSPEKQAHEKVLSQQIRSLDRLPADQKKELVQSMMGNDQSFDKLKVSMGVVREAAGVNHLAAITKSQGQVINLADNFNQNALSFELNSIEEVMKREKDEKQKAVLSGAADDCRSAMAAPFVERARMASFLLNNDKPYQAEKALAEALKIQIPSASLESTFVRDLRKNASEMLGNLKIENNLLELYDKTLTKLDIHKADGNLTEDELKAVKENKNSDQSARELATYLATNFKYLTRGHWTLMGKESISRKDIVNFEEERNKKINDLKL